MRFESIHNLAIKGTFIIKKINNFKKQSISKQMQSAQQMKFSAKVSFMGETKRMTQCSNFEELMMRTTESFTNLPTSFKFFYTDSENDLISVSSQNDLDEAPLFYFVDGQKTATVIKLTVAASSQQALDQLASNSDFVEESAFTIIDTCESARGAPEQESDKQADELA